MRRRKAFKTEKGRRSREELEAQRAELVPDRIEMRRHRRRRFRQTCDGARAHCIAQRG